MTRPMPPTMNGPRTHSRSDASANRSVLTKPSAYGGTESRFAFAFVAPRPLMMLGVNSERL